MPLNVVNRGEKLEQASKALIMLHGRGGTAADIISLADKVVNDTFYVTAPKASNNSWYPYGFMADDEGNEASLNQAIELVESLINKINEYIPKDKIYLLGFSQGACLSLEVAARSPLRYGGVFALAGGLIGEKLHEERYKGDFDKTPIFIGVGQEDTHIPVARCEESKLILDRLNAHVTLKVYSGMGHTINRDELDFVRKILLS